MAKIIDWAQKKAEKSNGFWFSVHMHYDGTGFLDRFQVTDVFDTKEDRQRVAAALRDVADSLDEECNG